MRTGMRFLVMSRNRGFVEAFKKTMEEAHEAEVFWATTDEEAEQLWAKYSFEVQVWDPSYLAQ